VRQEAQTCQKGATEGPQFHRGQNFTNDKINQAFQNLFGSSGPPSFMQTPSFNDNRHQIKAKPLYPNGEQDSPGRSKKKISSVFSPIPCKPQSQCSIFGVRGDNNTPYTPFANV
jgi:hypothetical protein